MSNFARVDHDKVKQKYDRDTDTDFKVIKRLMTGNLVKLDIFVIARLCDYLDCSMTDLVEYKR